MTFRALNVLATCCRHQHSDLYLVSKCSPSCDCHPMWLGSQDCEETETREMMEWWCVRWEWPLKFVLCLLFDLDPDILCGQSAAAVITVTWCYKWAQSDGGNQTRKLLPVTGVTRTMHWFGLLQLWRVETGIWVSLVWANCCNHRGLPRFTLCSLKTNCQRQSWSSQKPNNTYMGR